MPFGPRAALILAAAIGLSGCADDVLCAPIFPEAVAVDVRDSDTDARLVESARGAVQIGEIAESLQVGEVLAFPDPVLVGGHEEGIAEVRVVHAGYTAWTVVVRTRLVGDECKGWDTQALVARLQPE